MKLGQTKCAFFLQSKDGKTQYCTISKEEPDKVCEGICSEFVHKSKYERKARIRAMRWWENGGRK